MMKTKGVIILFLVLIVGFIGLSTIIFMLSQGVETIKEDPSPLKAEKYNYNFGDISIKNGPVQYTYALTNISSKPVVIRKVYTSCMCTKITLTTADNQLGPFSMPSHQDIPNLNQVIMPGETIKATAEFDPNAHGPAGVGRINRTIIIETENYQPVKLEFAAFVIP